MTTATKESVVTPERFKSGMTWNQYLAFINSEENFERLTPGGQPRGDANVERFVRNMGAWQVSEQGREALQSLPRLKMLVLGEDWCPDVYRGLPVLAEIAATAGWEIRIFARDENNDIMSEFLKGGQHESIPTAVMYTLDHEYVGHWIERPAVANEHMANMQKLFSRQEGESEDEMRGRIRQAYRDLQSSDEWASWRDATVDEIVELVRSNT
ncbi:MAG: thioredoxin family protein [Chloroflexi bacterium]|nr:thioredoxin family protein [Chloroflexota bacterium]MCY3697290.1 thioredoxin family protein [Chloroflexota bacterium]